jgi:hypothetical protein
MHFALSPSCLSFINLSRPSVASKRSPHLESDTVFSSSKRAALLRREVINPIHNRVDDARAWSESLPDNEATNNTDAPSDDDCEADDVGYVWEVTAAQPQIPDTTVEPWLYSDDQKWAVALLKLLDNMNAPDYAFASVLRRARGANAARYSFHPDAGLSRSLYLPPTKMNIGNEFGQNKLQNDKDSQCSIRGR